jgi:AraC-like DNA-binding protein
MASRRFPPRVERSAVELEWVGVDGPTVLQVAQGEILARSRDDLVRAEAGDLVCVAPAARCSLRAARGTAAVERLQVDPGWVAVALELAGSAEGTGGTAFLVDRRGSDRARQGARLLREIGAADEEPGGRLRRAARCVELLALTLEPRPMPLSAGATARGSERRERFLRGLQGLGNEPLDELTLPAFAARVGLSERHVSRLFQLELGKTFREHLAELRLERAKALLRETRMSVIEVAGETGWSSLAHFNAVFRRRVGSTPSQFRGNAAGSAS